jgi:hypothetical protein
MASARKKKRTAHGRPAEFQLALEGNQYIVLLLCSQGNRWLQTFALIIS